MVLLTIEFGLDQEPYISKILDEMKGVDFVLTYKHEKWNDDLVFYNIEFKTVYAAYIFGHKTAQLHKYVLGL